MIRTDITRINGTYWNLNGFWRGRLNNQSHAGQETIQDLINRTYTIGLTYDNPNSKWVAGFGRLYLPWATSLDTIDGGYFGRRLTQGVTAGIFAGSSPDPTSWNYDPEPAYRRGIRQFRGWNVRQYPVYQHFGFWSRTTEVEHRSPLRILRERHIL